MAKKYLKLDRPVKDYTAEELRERLGWLKNNAILLRTIILNEKDFIHVDYDRSLRGFWYSTVKPTLDKLGLLTEQDSTEEGLTKWDAELSRYVAELVRLGEVSYQDLHIVDTSRQRATPANAYRTVDPETYGYQVTAAPYPNIIISTEKDTVYGIIADIATFFGCSAISGKGQNSLAAMEDLLRQMKETADNQYAPIYILTMTDYDPAGYYIANTFYNQVQDLRAGLGINREVYIRRIGIFPAQLTADEIMQNWYTPKPANLDKWLEETGGINGRAKGLELDALEPDRIRKIFIDNLRPYIEQGQYSDFIKRAYLQRLILDAMRGKIAGIVAAAVNENLGSVEMIQADLMNIAAGGSRYIPTKDLCFTSRGQEIKEKVLAQFV
jgi:hypothetical protein